MNNPRWLEMLLSQQSITETEICDITSSLVFEQSCTSLNEDKCFYLFFWEHVVFLNHVCTQNERLLNEVHVGFVSSCDLYHMPNSQTCHICLHWSFCRFFANLHIRNRGDMVWSLCVFWSQSEVLFIYCRSVLKRSLLKVESLSLSHDPLSASISLYVY